MNNKIVSLTKKRISAIFLATVLIAGTIALSFPSFMTIGTAQAQQYYEMDNDYNSYEPEYPSYKPDYKPQYPSYGKDDRDKSNKDNSKSVSINKLKCINTNLNINGNNAGNISIGNKRQGYLGANSYDGAGYYDGHNNNKQDKGFDCIINNNNTNTNIVSTIPTEPTTTATLTVKKQVFGCYTPSGSVIMNCQELQNNSPAWLSCDDPTISTTSFCQNLQENFFDIEVLDEQDNKIQQFQGSQQGTTIQNLEPGTYTVNEIEYPIVPPPNLPTLNQLSEGDEF
ncbi:MAG TPA: hypothetical protein VLA74_02445, partial [Nitrososphaeraceae archaeon]|nr:hypothetical protein [Nitrososphaeraceae archaeon]